MRALRDFFAWAIRAARKVIAGLRRLFWFHDGGFVFEPVQKTDDEAAFCSSLIAHDVARLPYEVRYSPGVNVRRHPQDGAPFYCLACGMGYNEYMACELGACKLESKEAAEARQERGIERLLK